MTIEALKNFLKETVNNGFGDYPIYVRRFGDKEENL